MGLYKLCKHKARARDRCEHTWWGSCQFKGRLHRASLGRWANRQIHTKAEAAAVLDRMKDAIRAGSFMQVEANAGPLTFDSFADTYIERYVKLKSLRSADTIEYRLGFLRNRFGARLLSEIRVSDVEDMIQDLKAAGKKPATVNRHLALLRAMLNWAIEREYIDRTPFRKGSQAVIKLERENNRRSRRVAPDEETKLLGAANALLKALIIAALDTGMRRGELLSLRFGDVDFERQVIHVRAENAKSKRARSVPISTIRLKAVLEWLRIDAAGQQKPDGAPVFSNRVGEPVRDFRTAWIMARDAAGASNLWFHDLRGEYASRLVERGIPLSQVRDLLGHASIVTTERYDRQRWEVLEAAAKTLDTGETFNIPSSSEEVSSRSVTPTETSLDSNPQAVN